MAASGHFVLMGCGGHARSVADAILADHPSAKITFVDANAGPGEQIMGFDAVVAAPEGEPPGFIPAVGDNRRRRRESEGVELCSYVSCTAHVGRCSVIEAGCFVGSGAHIGPETAIGRGTIINTNAVVEHNVQIGAFSHVAPNSTICGGCRLGDLVLVGAGAILRPGVSVCTDVVIGAGSVVVADITEPGTYVGCPARRVIPK